MSGARNAIDSRRPAPTPPPYPQGWYAVGFSRELRAGSVLTRQFMGREIVLFRTASGRPAAVQAHCPHLGAHLGRGGVVMGENLRCPFHGFQFDTTGSCAATPYGSPPPAARLGVLELREVCGALLLFHDPLGAEATWEVTAPEQLDREWWPVGHATLRHRGHPQEVTENSADLGHLTVLHGFRNVEVLEPLRVDGQRLHTRYAIRRRTPFLPGSLPLEFDVHVDGLGFSRVELTMPTLGWQLRQLVLPTPIDRDRLELRLALTVRRRGRAWAGPDLLLQRFALHAFVSEVRADIAIWDHKCYLGRPALAAGDGPIGRYRKWAQQFYQGDSEPDTAENPFASSEVS
ncbi:Rieske 2Fe-2S domain-containing protein [Nocardia sp. NPDC049190]|uniref:Rieske 2Fe-2S domain-containing protein n=1 Tax=Nocardia sp. NPDC049190 TaxID=3155650 RepID=UPI0033C44DE1